VALTVENNQSDTKTAQIDQFKLAAYYTQLKTAAANLGDTSTDFFSLALHLPEVISYHDESGSEEEWALVLDTFQQASKAFQQFRTDEGAVLKKDLELRIQHILTGLADVEIVEKKRIPAIRERLTQALNDHLLKEHIDQNRFEQELIYYIDKLDITEEKIRLKSHADYFLSTLNHPDANGKKLGFISQEIGREINTIGSKANDAHMQQLVVNMKEELEKIKEQLLNVL
jgi:uncharacterized protein (TIGR00255 family)